MAAQIVPGEKSVLDSIFNTEAWHDILGGVGDVIGDVATIWQKIENIQGNKPLTPSPTPAETTPAYEPNLSLRDFAFTPNVTLLIVGGTLLIIALIFRK